MTKEDKDLLLKDICVRLPYGVIVKDRNGIHKLTVGNTEFTDLFYSNKCNIKPYLRPMSSMTDEEKEELKSKCTHTETEEDWEGVRCDVWGIQILDKYNTERWDNPIWASTINMDAIDWLNRHHFDYRGLIEKGLAIETTKENNPYEEHKQII